MTSKIELVNDPYNLQPLDASETKEWHLLTSITAYLREQGFRPLYREDDICHEADRYVWINDTTKQEADVHYQYKENNEKSGLGRITYRNPV